MTALEYATEKHKGQKRKDGKEYITHPIAVADIAVKFAQIEVDRIFKEDRYGGGIGSISKSGFLETFGDKDSFIKHVKDVAHLHDTVEDTDATLEDIKNKFGYLVYVAVDHLTKRQDEHYEQFVERIENTFVARLVKLADLYHNMSDLNEGSLKDKYRLAFKILRGKTYVRSI